MKILSLVLLNLVICISTARAEQKQDEKQPPSGLDQTVDSQQAPPEVVYPANEEITEDVIENIEGLQPTPEQYERLKKLKLERGRQKATPYVTPPKAVTRTLFVNLDPGASPPMIRLTQNLPSSIVFSDMSGSPWSIINHTTTDEMFQVSGKPEEGESADEHTNILTIATKKAIAYGNITVTLKGLSTPVIFLLSAGQKEVDMRVDAKIPGRNPDVHHRALANGLPEIDDDLGYFLDGVPPQEAQRLKVTGLEDTQAWFYKDSLYVRAKADAQYPAYISAARSTSGMSVYRYAQRHSSITFTVGGNVVTAFIEE